MKLSYQHLTDDELIKYAMDDAPVDSLAHLLASRYEDNVVHVASLEKEQASMIEDLERTHAQEICVLQEQLDTLLLK